MSVVSKLAIMGAAGSGGGVGWALDGLSFSYVNTTLATDSSGGIYAGASYDFLKTDADGNVEWYKHFDYGGTYPLPVYHALHIDASDNVFCSGYYRNALSTRSATTQRIDTSGAFQDEFYRVSSSSTEASFGPGASDGTYYYFPESIETGRVGFQMVRISDMVGFSSVDGTISSNRLTSTDGGLVGGHLGHARTSACFIDGSGNRIFVSPYADGTAYGMRISRFNSSGSQLSTTEVEHTSGSTNFIPQTSAQIVKDSGDNIYISSGQYLVKLNSSGSIVWQKSFSDSTGVMTFMSLALDDQGDIFALGYVNNSADYMLTIDPSSGSIDDQKIVTFNGSWRGYANAIGFGVQNPSTGRYTFRYWTFLVSIDKGAEGSWTVGADTYEISDTTAVSASTTTDIVASALSITYSEYSGGTISTSRTPTVSDVTDTTTKYDM